MEIKNGLTKTQNLIGLTLILGTCGLVFVATSFRAEAKPEVKSLQDTVLQDQKDYDLKKLEAIKYCEAWKQLAIDKDILAVAVQLPTNPKIEEIKKVDCNAAVPSSFL